MYGRLLFNDKKYLIASLQQHTFVIKIHRGRYSYISTFVNITSLLRDAFSRVHVMIEKIYLPLYLRG